MNLGLIFLMFSMFLATGYFVLNIRFQFSLSFLLFGSLLIIHGVALIVYLLWTGHDSYAYGLFMSSVDESETQATVLIAAGLMLLSVTAGSQFVVLAGRTLEYRVSSVQSRGAAITITDAYRLSGSKMLAIGAVAAGMLVISLTQGQLQTVTEYFSIDLSGDDRSLMRLESGGTPYYAYNVLLSSVAPFLFFVIYSSWRSCKRSLVVGCLALLFFAATLLGKFGTLSKAPPVIFISQFMLLRILLTTRSVNIGSVFRFVLIIVLLFGVIVKFTFSDLELSGVGAFLYYRMFDIPNEVLTEYFAAIPASIPHGWGAGIFPSLFESTDTLHIPVHTAVAALTRGSYDSTANAVFIADAWADFSWAGVVFFSFLVGGLVRAIDIYASRNGHNDEWACVMAGCTYGLFTLLSTAATTALITGGLATIPMLSWMLRSHYKAQIVPSVQKKA